jgi:hypothetical protein
MFIIGGLFFWLLHSENCLGQGWPDEGQLRQDAAYEDREFTGRFNNLVRVLHDFSETYNTGQEINAKNARAVRKAMRDLAGC